MARITPPTIITGAYKKIMVYSHDTYGLGNIRRMLAICQHLLQSLPNISILLVSGSPMLHSFRLPAGLDYIKLPCLNRGQTGTMAVKYLNADIESILNLRSELILAAAKNYQPDLVLVDKKPTGIQGELNATIEHLQQHLPQTKFVLLLRDILDTPEKTIQEWQRENYYQQVKSIYDRLLVVGMQSIFDLIKQYQLGTAIADKVRYCGYIQKETGLKSKISIRKSLGLKSAQKLVLVTPGGGEDGYFLIDNYLQGLKLASAKEYLTLDKIHSLIICGAEMPQPQQQQIWQQTRDNPRVRVLEFSNDVMSYVNAADAVVSMCGYNTITEVLQQSKPAIVVPRIKPGQEQLIRATSLAQAGFIKMIHPQQLSPSLLIETVMNCLITDKANVNEALPKLDFSGLPWVTDYLAMLLYNSFRVKNFPRVFLKSA